jgi:hypothetical protein
MSAVIQLTERERAEVRKRTLEFYRSQPLIVLEAMGELFDWHQPFAIGDAVELDKQINKVLSLYLERCGTYAEAEREELDGIARGIF